MSVFDHVYYPFHHDHINTPRKHPPDNPLWTSDGWGGVAWKLGGYNPPGGGLDKSLPGLAAETAVWDPVPSNPTWSLQTCETTSAYVFDARGSHSISQVALQLANLDIRSVFAHIFPATPLPSRREQRIPQAITLYARTMHPQAVSTAMFTVPRPVIIITDSALADSLTESLTTSLVIHRLLWVDNRL